LLNSPPFQGGVRGGCRLLALDPQLLARRSLKSKGDFK